MPQIPGNVNASLNDIVSDLALIYPSVSKQKWCEPYAVSYSGP